MIRRFSVGVLLVVGMVMNRSEARDLGVLPQPIHQGKFTSSLLYEHLKLSDDFDSRGRGDFTSDITGAEFSYGITDRVALALKGGVLINPQEDIQGSQWESRAGYLYGMDVLNEVFPATPGWKPGVYLTAGVTGFQVPLDRTNVSGTWQTVDQMMTGVEFHGTVLTTFKAGPTDPYLGIRGFGSSVKWRDNEAMGSTPDQITGHAHGNVSIIVGLPFRLMKDVRVQLEGRFISETAMTAGFTIASF